MYSSNNAGEGVLVNEGAEAKYLEDSDDEDQFDRTARVQTNSSRRSLKGSKVKIKGSRVSGGKSALSSSSSGPGFVKLRAGVKRGTEARRTVASSYQSRRDGSNAGEPHQATDSSGSEIGGEAVSRTSSAKAESSSDGSSALYSNAGELHTPNNMSAETETQRSAGEGSEAGDKTEAVSAISETSCDSSSQLDANSASRSSEIERVEPQSATEDPGLQKTPEFRPVDARKSTVPKSKEASGQEETTKKRTRHERPNPSETNKRKREEVLDVEGVEEYTAWMPPSDQSGDGTTALNKKLGY